MYKCVSCKTINYLSRFEDLLETPLNPNNNSLNSTVVLILYKLKQQQAIGGGGCGKGHKGKL